MTSATARALLALLTSAICTAALLLAAAGAQASEPSSNASQGIEVTVSPTIGWGSANGCTQNMKTNSFEASPSSTSATLGAFNALPSSEASTWEGTAKVWVGCVTANTEVASVVAEGAENLSSGANTLALANVAIGLVNATGGKLHGGAAGCTITAEQASAGSCTLAKDGTPRTLLSAAAEGTTELDWQYQLDLPADQPAGVYTGGQVTFIATA